MRKGLAAAVLLVAVLVSACGLKTYRMAGHSMEPTLIEGQTVFLDQNAYASAMPQRGDLVMFRSESGSRVSRVIGLPNDRVIIRGGAVYIADQERPDGEKLDEVYLTPGVLTEAKEEVYSVPEDRYFVLSDNRQSSADSRSLGPIVREDILGKVKTTSR